MKKVISYKNLVVNPENYRFDPVKNQSQAIDLMLSEKGNEIYNLAEHIAKNGLDPAKDFRVLEDKKGNFIVLDGNRRATAIKCLNDSNIIKDLKLRKVFGSIKIKSKNIKKISCIIYKNEKDAAQWIKLDHTGKNLGTGQESWSAAAKDRFSYKFEGKASPSMQMVDLMEKETGKKIDTKKLKISTIDRILSNPTSRSILGIDIKSGVVEISKDRDSVIENTQKLFDKVIDDDVNVSEVYTKEKNVEFMKDLFDINQPVVTSNSTEVSVSGDSKDHDSQKLEIQKRRTPRERTNELDLFGENLYLVKGQTNSIYWDILDLNKFYTSNKDKLSKSFPAMIRMSLRLLVESATAEGEKIDTYIKDNFSKAKIGLTKDQKTTLSNNSIDGAEKLIQLLQTGAHNYTNSTNFEQTVAMSIIIAAILKNSHSK